MAITTPTSDIAAQPAEAGGGVELDAPIRMPGVTEPVATGSLPTARTWMLFAANAVALAFAYGPLVGPFFAKQWSQPQYQYFPFVIAAFVWLLVRNSRDGVRSGEPPKRILTTLTLVGSILAWVLLGLAYLVPSPWLAVVSAILLIGAGLLRLSQRQRIYYVWGLWLMLWLIVPLPLNRDQQLITGLQRLSSRLSSAFLDAVGVEHLMEGNTLTLPGKQFFVDEACSGIVSVLSIIACAVIYGIWRDRRAAHVIILALCGVGWATLMNVGRITTIAVVYDWFDMDWSAGASHETLGLVFFMLVFLALVCTDLFLVGLLAPIESTLREVRGAPQTLGVTWIRLWDWLFTAAPREAFTDGKVSATSTACRLQSMALGWGGILSFVVFPVLMLATGTLGRAENRPVAAAPQQVVDRALACQQSTLPARIHELSLAKFSPVQRERNDILGNFSRTYEYRDSSGAQYVVSCDFPYQGGWHELTVCYQGIGWDLEDRRVVHEEAQANGHAWTDMEAEFTKPDGDQGFLTACAFDENGMPLDLPAYTLWEDVWRRITVGGSGLPSQVAFQVQVWAVSNQPINDEQRATARSLLRQARETFYKVIISPTAKSS